MNVKPFHESIIDAINACSSVSDLGTLADLIITTKIPKDHDVIISAFKEKMKDLDRLTDFGVEESVLEQKKEQEK